MTIATRGSTAVMARRVEPPTSPVACHVASGSPPEEWRSVLGWPGYEVSSLGHVRSWKWPTAKRQWAENRDRGARILRPYRRNGYPSVVLCGAGVGRVWKSVHVLVLEAFVGPRPTGHHGAHGDGNPINNAVENLRWATPSENNADKAMHGTQYRGESVGSSKLTADDVRKLRDLRAAGVKNCELTRRFGVCRNTISNITSGRTWRTVVDGAKL